MQGEELFSSWSNMFSGSDAAFSSHVTIYSFDGRDVITDPSWWATEFTVSQRLTLTL